MDKTFARWQELFEDVRKIEDLDSQALYKKALPCFYDIYSQFSYDGGSQIGVSRKGGLPDLPETIPWPIENDKAMTFLAQINFSELEPGFAAYLPQQGWLYFFISTPEVWSGIPHRVIYYDGPTEALQQTSLPQSAKTPDTIYKSHSLTFETGFTLYGELLDEIFKDRSVDKLFEIIHELYQAECTRVGGYPMCFQTYPSEHFAYLALSGFDLMHKYGSSIDMHEFIIQRRQLEEKQPEHVEFLRTEVYTQIREYEQNIEYHKKRMKTLRPIFVLDSDDDMQWGDLGFLQFFMFQEDLEKRDFSRTCCDLIST